MGRGLSPLQRQILREASKHRVIRTGYVLDNIMKRRDRAARIIVSKSFRRLERRGLILRVYIPRKGGVPDAEMEITGAGFLSANTDEGRGAIQPKKANGLKST